MFKNNRLLIIITIFLLLILGVGAFYWFEYRPYKIKQDCSYITVTIPEVLEVTTEQAQVNRKENKDCKERVSEKSEQEELSNIETLFEEDKCDLEYPIQEEQEYQPERQEIKEASEEEYSNCLRRNGLLE